MISLRGDRVHCPEPKSRKSRIGVAIGEMVVQTLMDRQPALTFNQAVQDSQVCARPGGGIMEPEALSHRYKSIAAGCGLSGVRFHNLRHMHASLLLTSRIPIHVALAGMGHEGIQTTVDTYGHVLSASDVEAEWTLENQLAAPFAKCLQNEAADPGSRQIHI